MMLQVPCAMDPTIYNIIYIHTHTGPRFVQWDMLGLYSASLDRLVLVPEGMMHCCLNEVLHYN